MIKRQIVFGPPGEGLWRFEVLVGILLVLAGVLIAVFPAILVALISGTVILSGLALMVAGWRSRQLMRYGRTGQYDVIDVPPDDE